MSEEIVVQGQGYLDSIWVYGFQGLIGIAILVGGLFFAKWAQHGVGTALDKVPKFDQTLAKFFASMAKYLVVAFTVLLVLSQFGVQTASLITVLGAASLAIGLALQDTLKSVAGGVMLLIFRPFVVGHYIETAGYAGTVKAIDLFTTELATSDGIRIVIPNSQVWGAAVTNYSANPKRRINLVIGIGYEDKIDAALKVIQQTLKKDERILDDPEPALIVNALGPHSVDIAVRAWTKRTDFGDTKSDLQKALKEALMKKGITIPYPQQVVHIVSDGDSAKAA